jgi:hypothetical protein
VVDGGWRHTEVEDLSCELVRGWHFLGSGVPVKQLRFWRKGIEVEREGGRERERERESGMRWGRLGEQSQC